MLVLSGFVGTATFDLGVFRFSPSAWITAQGSRTARTIPGLRTLVLVVATGPSSMCAFSSTQLPDLAMMPNFPYVSFLQLGQQPNATLLAIDSVPAGVYRIPLDNPLTGKPLLFISSSSSPLTVIVFLIPWLFVPQRTSSPSTTPHPTCRRCSGIRSHTLAGSHSGTPTSSCQG